MEAKLPINAAPSQTNDMNAAFTRTLGRRKEGRKEGKGIILLTSRSLHEASLAQHS